MSRLLNAPVEGDPLGQSSLFLVDALPDSRIWCKKIHEKLNPLSRYTHVTDDRQTDYAISQSSKRNLITFG